MTLNEALSKFYELRRGVPVSDGDLISFITELDLTVKQEIFDTHEGEAVALTSYTPENGGVTLLIPPPYDSLYLRYLEMKTDYAMGESVGYNSAAAMFSAGYSAFRNYYNSTHMPNSERIRYTP